MTLQTRDKRALVVLGVALVLALIVWMTSSSSSRATLKVAEPVDTIDRATKRLAAVKTAAATLDGKTVVMKQVSAELAEREKGLIPGGTADQAQAQLLQILDSVGKTQSPPLAIRQKELGQPRAYGDAYGQVTASVTIDCRIDELVNFLSALSARPEIIATDEIRFGTAHAMQKNMPVRLTVSGIVARALVPDKSLKKGLLEP